MRDAMPLPTLPPALYEAMLRHAQLEYPREACGVVVSTADGVLQYRPCRNVAPAEAGRDRFQVDPRDWAAAEDLGAIRAVVHSHPDESAEPSDADRWMCERTGLAWFVIAVPGGAIRKIEPAPLPLVGRRFHHGVVDCYTLVQDYYRQVLAIDLPDVARTDDWWRHGQDLYREHFADAGFVCIGGPDEADLREHDGLLMQVHADVPNHAAVYVGGQRILHHLWGRLSGHDVWGGYWRRHCTHVLRHRSLL